jgi:hypothetical protein
VNSGLITRASVGYYRKQRVYTLPVPYGSFCKLVTIHFTKKTNSCTYFNTFIFTLKHQKIVKNPGHEKERTNQTEEQTDHNKGKTNETQTEQQKMGNIQIP